MQQLPASPDAFVWLRLYQEQMRGLVPAGPDQPLWWTLRRPFRQLAYHAALRMFTRAEDSLGKGWTLHDLRHTAAYRMARDPEMPLTDIQWIMGHARLSTTQIYLTPTRGRDRSAVTAFHARRASRGPPKPPARVPATGRKRWKRCSGASGSPRPQGRLGAVHACSACCRAGGRCGDAAVPAAARPGRWPGTS